MKLGITIHVFEGEELLDLLISEIKEFVDFVSVIYQNVSYFDNKNETIEEKINAIKADNIFKYIPDLSKSPKENELISRNKGLEIAREFGCTHHITADVDEFYPKEKFKKLKTMMGNYDSSIVNLKNYFKYPSWLINNQNQKVTFIHKIDRNYKIIKNYFCQVDVTRRVDLGKCKVFTEEEFCVYHLSYVRKNIKRKLENNTNWMIQDVNKFIEFFNSYKLGEKLKLPSDMINRRTIFDNSFKNELGEKWQHLLQVLELEKQDF